jgi:hypothetical protein
MFAEDSTIRKTIEIVMAGAASGAALTDDQRIAMYLAGYNAGVLKLETTGNMLTYDPGNYITPDGMMYLPIALPYVGTQWMEAQLVPAYAAGGLYGGGLALVGEDGPELINFTRPGQVYTAGQTASMLNNDEMVAELRALRREVADLRHEARATASHTSKTARLIERAMPDGDALATRVMTDLDAPVTPVPM